MYNYFLNSYFGFLIYFIIVPLIIIKWFSFISSIKTGQIIWFFLGLLFILVLYDYRLDYAFAFKPIAFLIVWRFIKSKGKSENPTSISIASNFFGFGQLIGLITVLFLLAFN